MNPPQINLQPGMTGTAVKQLQDWLVQQGVMTQAQVNTGYGTYGPQTKDAVTKWQQQYGVQAGSNAGYWGPLSIAAAQNVASGNLNVGGFGGKPLTPSVPPTQPISSASSSQTPTTKSEPVTTTKSDSTQTAQGIPYNSALAKYGITQDIWNQGNATQQAVWASLGNAVTLANQTPISSITMQEALAAAQKDPNVTKPFADALALDTTNLNQSLSQIQTAITNDSQKNQMQFESDRKALAEQTAAAGQAYSGFRGKAQENLATTEAGIVTSSRAKYQNDLNNATSSFESKYGTNATPVLSASYVDPNASANTSISGLSTPGNNSISSLTGQTTGGVTGSQSNAPGGAEYNAINTAAANAYKAGVYPA